MYWRRCSAREHESSGWRVNRTLAPRRRLREARPRAPAIERPPSPDPPYPPSAPSFPRVTYRHPFGPLPTLIPSRLASSHPPSPRLFPHPASHASARAHTHFHHIGATTTTVVTITTTTTTTPLTLIHAALNYGAYIGTYRYVYLRTWTWRIYAARCSLVYPRLSRTQLYSEWAGYIARAREVAEHEVYSLCHYRRPAEFRGSFRAATHVTRAASRRDDRPLRFDDDDDDDVLPRARVMSIFI